MREVIQRDVLTRIAESLGADQAPQRASFVSAQVVGLVMARCVVEVEPLASLDAEEVAQIIAPVFQRYLTEPL